MRLLAVELDREGRVLRVAVLERSRQTDRAGEFQEITHGSTACAVALQPLDHLLGNALVDDLERGQHVGPQPRHERLEETVRLVLVDLLRAAAGRRRHLTSASVETQRVLELLVPVRQLEEDFIGELLVLEVRRLERLEEVEVEVPWRLGRGPLVGCAEEQVAPARDLVFPPLDLVFPNLVAPDVGRLIGQFQHTGQGVEVVLVEVRVGERVRLVLDFGVVVDGLLQVQVILVVLRVVRDELPAHRLHDFLEARFHRGAQEVAGLLRDRGEQAQAVLELLGGRADLRPDVVGRQPVDRQAVDDSHAPSAAAPSG